MAQTCIKCWAILILDFPFSSTASCIIPGDPTTDNNNLLSGGILKSGEEISIQGEQEFPVVGTTGLTGWTVTAPVGGTAGLTTLAICFDNP